MLLGVFPGLEQTHSCLLTQPVCSSCRSFTAEPLLFLSKWSFTELCISGSDWTFADKKDVFWLPGQHQLSSCLQSYVTWMSFVFRDHCWEHETWCCCPIRKKLIWLYSHNAVFLALAWVKNSKYSEIAVTSVLVSNRCVRKGDCRKSFLRSFCFQILSLV